MKLWCYDDEGKKFRTGRAIQERALARGWDCRLFRKTHEVGHDHAYAFMRIEQWPPGLARSKAVAAELLLTRPNLTVIPGWDQIAWYEDKISQAHDLAAWMPETRVIRSPAEAYQALAALGLPLVSKASDGSSCANVRVLRSTDAALDEIEAVFERDGLPLRLGGENKDARQKGYLLWQKFLAGNDHIYRIGVCGRFGWMFKEHNRPGTALASGSGLYDPVHELGPETREAWDAARTFAREARQPYCGLDYARDPDTGAWRLLETTLAWGMWHPRGTIACTLLNEDGTPTGRMGADLFDTLLDEIAAGQFLSC